MPATVFTACRGAMRRSRGWWMARRFWPFGNPRTRLDYESLKRTWGPWSMVPDAPVELHRVGTDEMRLKADLEAGQRLLVQESYDPAWRAYANGGRCRSRRMRWASCCSTPVPGEHEMVLRFETPLENRVGQVISMLTFAIVLLLFWRPRRARRPSAPAPQAP